MPRPIENLLLVGACSAIASALARRLAEGGARMLLTGRDPLALERLAADLRVRGASAVHCETLDLLDQQACIGLIERSAARLGRLDAVVLAAGLLPRADQADDPQSLQQTLTINACAPIALAQQAAVCFERQGHGLLVAIGSVSGDRGRATNAAYGAAKGALEIYLSGLRQRLERAGARVLLVKPGFVDTPMTAAFRKGALWARPEQVAAATHRAMQGQRRVIYTPWFWRPLMRLIREIPEFVFVRLKF